MPDFTIIEAPSHLGLRPGGVEHLPDALLNAGLARRLGARRHARLAVPPYDARRDLETNILNPARIRDFAIMLADIVGPVVARGSFPIVLGGDCSILLGNLLALRRSGRRYGLLFLDGHADFYQPEASPTGEAADMDLALSTGRGPALLTDIEGMRPLVRDADVAVLGPRDADQARQYGSQPLPPKVFAQDLAEVRRIGAEEAARAAIEHLCRPEIDGFWIHLDVDVLDDAIMPAVGYRIPDGLSWEDLETILRAAMRSGRAAGINITIFEPPQDKDGSIARALVDSLARALVRSPDARLELCALRQRRMGLGFSMARYA
ncbi:arginase family protein [Dongia deserti]|uniref:arginase family protein n=1 Tax=Dongia deserti TaxID=2268030 RepID=UPI000E652566|nr:arginase family protein [Dongia deserti]